MTAARAHRVSPARRRGALARDRVIVLVTTFTLLLTLGPHLPRFTTDSESYLDVARSVFEGHGLSQQVVDFWRPALPDPLGLWPPLYPVVVATLARLGVPLERAATLVSQLAYPAFGLLFHALALLLLPATGALVVTLLACGTLAVAFASGMAWSEMLYLALSAGALLMLVRLLEHGVALSRESRVVRAAVLAGSLAGLAALTRYIGIVLLPLGLVALTLGRVRTRVLVAWALPALLLPGLWCTRNLLRFGSPLGPGLPHAHGTVTAIAGQFVPALRWGFVPWPLELSGAVSAIVVLVMTALALFALMLGVRRALIAGYVALYVLVLFTLRASLSFNVIGYRYLTPVHPFLWLAAAVSLAWFAERLRFAATLARGSAIALLLLTAVAAGRFVVRLPSPAPEWRERQNELSELRALLAEGGGPVLSDAGHRVRTATGRQAVQVPESGFALRPFSADDEARWREAGVRLAVFRRLPGDSLAAASDSVEQVAALEPRFGRYLAERLASARPHAWPVAARSERFVLYRIP